MSDKSNFKNGVPITGSDLSFESEARIKNSQRIIRDGMQTGILEGFTVAVGGSPTLIDIAPGNGYVGDIDFGDKLDSVFGSYIKNNSGDTLTTSWVAGVAYYVNAIYEEVVTIQRPNEDGTTLEDVRTENTSIDCSFEIITVANYLVLSDEDKHKRLKLAKIIPSSTSLVASDITNSFIPVRVKTAGTLLLAGVRILEVSSTAVDGISQIEWDASGVQLRWKDAGEPSFGSYVDVSIDGVHFLYSNGKYVKIETTSITFPISSGVFNVTISDLYEGVVRPASGADRVLRSFGGTALKTPTNPLGLDIDDIGGGEAGLSSHRLYMHKNGIVGLSNALRATIGDVGGTAVINVAVPTGSDRFFIKGDSFTAIQGSQYPVTPGAVYTLKFDSLSATLWNFLEIYIDDDGELKYNIRAQITGLSIDVKGLIPIDLRLLDESGTFTVDYVITANKKTLQFNNGEVVTLIPNIDYVYELIGENGYDRMIAFVDWDELATGDGTDVWNVINPPMNNLDNTLPLCNVGYYGLKLYGNGGDFLTGGGIPYDKRIFGTLSDVNFRNDSKEYIETAGRSVLNNGVVRGLGLSNTASALTIAEGVGFVKGKEVRIDNPVSIDATFLADGKYYVWLGSDGTIETIKEPLDGSLNLMEEVLRYLMDERAVIAEVVISSSTISYVVDKRNFAGIGRRTDENDAGNVYPGVQMPEIMIRNTPNLGAGRILEVDNSMYQVQNLMFDRESGLWALEDKDKYGTAIVVTASDDGATTVVLKEKMKLTAPSALTDIPWPIPVVENFRPYFKNLYGDGSDGDVVLSVNTNLAGVRVKQYRNLTLNAGIQLTGDGPFLMIGVQEKLTINTGALIHLNGGDGGDGGLPTTTPSIGGVGGGGDGGNGGNGGPSYSNYVGKGGKVTSSNGVGFSDSYFSLDGGNGEQAFGGTGGGVNEAFSFAGGGAGGGGNTTPGGGQVSGGGGGAGGGIGGNGGRWPTMDGFNGFNTFGNTTYGLDPFAYFGIGGIPPFMNGNFNQGGCLGWGGGGGGGSMHHIGGVSCGGAGGSGGGGIYIEANEIEIIGAGGINFSAVGGNGGRSKDAIGVNAGGGAGGGGGSIFLVCGISSIANTALIAKMNTSGGTGGLSNVGGIGGNGGKGIRVAYIFSDLS